MTVEQSIKDSISCKEKVLGLAPQIQSMGKAIEDSLKAGKKIILAGNGGSAAQAQHIAAEFVVRFKKERPSLPSLALNVDTSILTACANDYSFDEVFSRQLSSLGNEGDCFIAISTSGNSPNILRAIEVCKEKRIKVIGLTGKDGGKMKELCDCLIIPEENTARIQEAHIMVMHIWCEGVDNAY